MVIHMFMAFTLDKQQGKRELLFAEFAVPGEIDLFKEIRRLGQLVEIGRYRHLDLDIESATHGFHLFEHGIVKLSQVHI